MIASVSPAAIAPTIFYTVMTIETQQQATLFLIALIVINNGNILDFIVLLWLSNVFSKGNDIVVVALGLFVVAVVVAIVVAIVATIASSGCSCASGKSLGWCALSCWASDTLFVAAAATSEGIVVGSGLSLQLSLVVPPGRLLAAPWGLLLCCCLCCCHPRLWPQRQPEP